MRKHGNGAGPVPPRGKAAEGRSNRSRGAYHEEAWLAILREYFPNADRTFPKQDGYRVGDYKGIGDLCMEATVEGWARMGSLTASPESSKIAEVHRDMQHLGYDLWCIIKGVARQGARTQWFLVGDAAAWLLILTRLQHFERLAADYKQAMGQRFESSGFVALAEKLDELEAVMCERNDEWQAGYDARKREEERTG